MLCIKTKQFPKMSSNQPLPAALNSLCEFPISPYPKTRPTQSQLDSDLTPTDPAKS